jgi:hypothetical protein
MITHHQSLFITHHLSFITYHQSLILVINPNPNPKPNPNPNPNPDRIPIFPIGGPGLLTLTYLIATIVDKITYIGNCKKARRGPPTNPNPNPNPNPVLLAPSLPVPSHSCTINPSNLHGHQPCTALETPIFQKCSNDIASNHLTERFLFRLLQKF